MKLLGHLPKSKFPWTFSNEPFSCLNVIVPIPSYINIEQINEKFSKWRIIQGNKLNPVKVLKVKFLDETKMKIIRINEMHVFLLEGIPCMLPFSKQK